MAKHKHRSQESIRNNADTSANANNRNSIPFGIDPMQLMGLLGGNFDMNNMGNMLASMNTNGFNMGNLNSLAQMMGLNLDNNLFQGTTTNQTNEMNKNLYSNANPNMKKYGSNNVTKNGENFNTDMGSKKSDSTGANKSVKDNDENLEFLMALRSYVHPDRIRFIDKIIEAYRSGEFNED